MEDRQNQPPMPQTPEGQEEELQTVESFVPTDYFQEEKPKKRIGRGGIIAICAGVLVLALVTAGLLYYNNLRNNPASFFPLHEGSPSPTVAPATPNPSEDPTPSPTVDPYTALEEQADLSMMKNIVNVAFIGVDYAEERLTGYGGKAEDNAFHADVILILAINFEENRVDMISIPRDTYANIPGVKGIYKINASLDCGGGLFAENGAGFEKVCEAAEWMLGDIPVDYYYAVTMPAVKELADAVGGVEYDLELDFTIQGRSYKKGLQHMDGQAVLDYLRVRKNIPSSMSGDNNRVNRQKKMMIALFESMKQQNLILKIPELLSAFEGQLFTNTNLSQTAALALFAYGLDADNIGMYSMGSGSSGTSGNTNIFNWNFCLTDQANRVKIIKEIYGVDVPQYREYTRTYAFYRWYSMLTEQYLSTCEPLTEYVAELIAADDLLPTISPEPTVTPDVSITPDPIVTPPPTETPLPETPTPPPTLEITPEPEDTEVPASSGTEGAPEAAPDSQLAAGRAASLSVVRLSAGGALRAETAVTPFVTQQYTAEQRALYAEYLEALETLRNAASDAETQASRYRKGNSNSLSGSNTAVEEALSAVKETALRVASEFGYKTSKLVWTYRYEYDKSFNEIRVNFN